MNLHDRDILMAGRQEGRKEQAIETAEKLSSMGLSVEQISEVTGLSLEDVIQIQKDSQK